MKFNTRKLLTSLASLTRKIVVDNDLDMYTTGSAHGFVVTSKYGDSDDASWTALNAQGLTLGDIRRNGTTAGVEIATFRALAQKSAISVKTADWFWWNQPPETPISLSANSDSEEYAILYDRVEALEHDIELCQVQLEISRPYDRINVQSRLNLGRYTRKLSSTKDRMEQLREDWRGAK